MGEVNLEGNAKLTGVHCTANNIEFRAKDNARVRLQLTKTDGKINVIEAGGTITLLTKVDRDDPTSSAETKQNKPRTSQRPEVPRRIETNPR